VSGVIRRAVVCASMLAAGSGTAATIERWELLIGGAVAGSETVTAEADGLAGAGGFTFQGARIETTWRIALDPSGGPAAYTLSLVAPGAKVAISSADDGASLALTITQNGAVAGTKSFPSSPSLVILDNNAFGQYRQLARLLTPDGPVSVKVDMLVPQILAVIGLEAVRLPGTWRWSADGASGAAVRWEMTSPTPLLVRVWQDIDSGRIVQVELPSARTVARLAGAALVAEPGAAATPPAYLATPVEQKDLTIVSGACRLGATVTRPRGAAEGLPGVVIVGGSGPTDRDGSIGGVKVYRDLAVGLAAKGFVALRFDKRTYAYRGEPAALDVDRMGLREEYLDDTAAALRLLAADPWIDASRLSLAGHSLGAWVLPLVVGALGADAGLAKHLVLIAPQGRDMGVTLLRQLRYRLSLTPGVPALERMIADAGAAFAVYRSTGRMRDPVLGAGAAYWQDVLDADPIGAAARLSVPTTILRGAKDFQIDAADLADWQQALGARPNVTLLTLDGLNHLLVDVPEGPSTGVEYYREGWVAPAAIEAVAAGLAR